MTRVKRGGRGARPAARTPSAKSAVSREAHLLGALVLHGQPGLLHQAATQRGPDGAHGQRARRRQLARVAERLRQQVAVAGQAVAQAEGQRLLTADAPPGEQQVGGGLAAHGRRAASP